jgi:hypothetical protein
MTGSVGSWCHLCCLTVACEMSDPGIVDSLIPALCKVANMAITSISENISQYFRDRGHASAHFRDTARHDCVSLIRRAYPGMSPSGVHHPAARRYPL